MAPWLRFPVKFLYLVSGLVIWATHFLLVYGLNGVACARRFSGTAGWENDVVPAAVLAATAVAIVINGVILIAAVLGRGPGIGAEPDASVRNFWQVTTALLAGLSIVAVAWTGLPALMIGPCA